MNDNSEHIDPLEHIWVGDMLERRKDAETIRQFTLGHLELRDRAGQDRTYVLNLNADWGAGKTFFLERFKRHLEHFEHVAVYVNAWEDDYSDDPFLTVVDAMQRELTAKLLSQEITELEVRKKIHPFFKAAKKVAGNAMLTGGKHFLARYFGNEAIDLVGGIMKYDEGWEGDSDLDEAIQKTIKLAIDATGAEILNSYKIQREAQRDFKKALEEISQEVLSLDNVNAPIFVLIDELDRCRPSYAIELLERVKHIFSLKNFVFILGTDTEQLGHAVRGVYGQGFDGPRYLKRFIDRTYTFQQSNTLDFVQHKLNRLGLSEELFTVPKPYSVSSYISNFLDNAECSLRDIDQILEIVETFVALWPYENLKIDMVTLLHRVYLQHQDKNDVDFVGDPLAKRKISFVRHGGGEDIKLEYLRVVQEAGESYEIKSHEVDGSWKEWLWLKVDNENQAYRKRNMNRSRIVSTRQEYEEMLKQVVALQRD
ncbi:KAP family P-loop NTPase fold protein [Tritonibacter mobilis]|uniref:KAP family P-loop NTPase fold protein n=1 Tax=Tritonibacter mobilis TaxID=379347 RepID=UPI000806F231|nr:P-loop NTPase fold protein [Tritonibacter mobilis]